MTHGFDREVVARLQRRLQKGPPLIQVVTGPRQVGKTTAARRVAQFWDGPVHFATADQPTPPGPEWVESNWSVARSLYRGRAAATLRGPDGAVALSGKPRRHCPYYIGTVWYRAPGVDVWP